MVSKREELSSLDYLNGPKIVSGDDCKNESKWKGRINLDHSSFNNVLYVPGHVSNLLLVYQMTHSGSPNNFVFTPNDVEIIEILNGRVIEKCFVDHSSKVYKLSHFMPFSNPSALLNHANESRKLCHEKFGHLNYKYLSDLCHKYMVIGFPKIKFSKGVCQ